MKKKVTPQKMSLAAMLGIAGVVIFVLTFVFSWSTFFADCERFEEVTAIHIPGQGPIALSDSAAVVLLSEINSIARLDRLWFSGYRGEEFERLLQISATCEGGTPAYLLFVTRGSLEGRVFVNVANTPEAWFANALDRDATGLYHRVIAMIGE